ncbi:MAG: cytochrome c peroxidase [Thermodesulfobacteriota bacterium]
MNKPKSINWLCGAALSLLSFSVLSSASAVQAQTPQEQLGDFLYNDLALSEPAGQGCVSCHDPNFGFADPDQHLPVSEGVIPGRFGSRNSPSAAYALFFPEFTLKGGIQGGQFWDGRALNLAEQAKGPFLNPVEMNNTSRAEVISKIAFRPYELLFEQVCGPNAFDPANVDTSYNCMADAIAAFEMTFIFREFSSKFDAVEAGLVEFTAQEDQGRALFSGRGKCGHCHPAKAGGNKPVVFTDFKFHNIGIPSNQEVLRLIDNPTFVDLGLGGREDISLPKEFGRFKTTHLRDVELTPPYMHNGVLATLKQVVHFYNTRDVLAECDPALGSDDPGFGIDCWPAPEVPDNLDSSFVGDLGLTDAEEDAIVAYMLTFTDGYVVP